MATTHFIAKSVRGIATTPTDLGPWTTAVTTYNVKDFGAAGDGVTDDTAEIQAAMDAVPTYSSGMGGAIVLFPPGQYVVSSTLTIGSGKSGITLLGAGEASTWIEGSVSGAPVLSTYYDNTSTVTDQYVTIEGMVIKNTSTSASSCALRIVQAGTVNVKHCQISGAANYPSCVLDAGYLYYFEGCNFQNLGTGNYGVRAGENGLGLVNVLHFFDCSFSAGAGGAQIKGSQAVLFNMCHFEGLGGGSSASAIVFDSCTGAQVNSSYFENAGDYCVRTLNAAYGTMGGLTVQGCFMYNPKVGMIDITDCLSAVILTNTLRPGSNNTNATGISGISNSTSATVMPQHFMDWGSGTQFNTSNYNINSVGFGTFDANGTPTTGLNGIAEKGALCIDRSAGKLYINTGTKASNTWTVVGTQT